ncbi:MAG: 1-deoxy-D-xylulose-5-phosphate synthase [Candidatus Saccharimonas sp.]|nr:1-deoxy-D-xylulose-5-phosphate synthase [Planctomycetaceae bacterium]
MYIERKAGELTGEARIGRVTFSKTGKTLSYRGLKFQSLKGFGFKANYRELESGEDYWISGCKKDGSDRLYGERVPVEIDEDVRAEYWRDIRGLPDCTDRPTDQG